METAGNTVSETDPVWPMLGWLEEFRELGLVDVDPASGRWQRLKTIAGPSAHARQLMSARYWGRWRGLRCVG
jgi:hypothetical protein